MATEPLDEKWDFFIYEIKLNYFSDIFLPIIFFRIFETWFKYYIFGNGNNFRDISGNRKCWQTDKKACFFFIMNQDYATTTAVAATASATVNTIIRAPLACVSISL